MKKHSRKRDAILEKIRSTDLHPSAEWVYTELKPEFPDLSLGTVYRNIAGFLEDGLIISVGNVNGQERYDGNTSEHAHFICSRCGGVIDVEESSDMAARQEIERKYGFFVKRYDKVFHGLCANCR